MIARNLAAQSGRKNIRPFHMNDNGISNVTSLRLAVIRTYDRLHDASSVVSQKRTFDWDWEQRQRTGQARIVIPLSCLAVTCQFQLPASLRALLLLLLWSVGLALFTFRQNNVLALFSLAINYLTFDLTVCPFEEARPFEETIALSAKIRRHTGLIRTPGRCCDEGSVSRALLETLPPSTQEHVHLH